MLLDRISAVLKISGIISRNILFVETGRKDVFWNYLATFLRIASSVLLLPLILNRMPSEMVGIWTVFMTISFLSSLLDFGFNASFTRNVSFVFSGVRNLKVEGYELIDQQSEVDYGLLKGLIAAMRWFYRWVSVVVVVLLLTAGTFYLRHLLQSYKGDTTEVYIAWGILCFINSYNLYTFYYDSLLQGKGLIKKSKQITIIGQSLYLIVTSVLILFGFGLIAIVSAQAVSVIIIRLLSNKAFFTVETKKRLSLAKERSYKEIIRAVYPNALKVGLTSLGGFLINRSTVIIGSLYLTLDQMASYGITIQLIGVMATMANIYTTTYQAKIVSFRVDNNIAGIKSIYLKGQLLLVATFVTGGLLILFLAPPALDIIRSKTDLMPFYLTLTVIIISLLETNHSTAGNILLTKNEVPFFKASLISGACIVAGLFVALRFTGLGIYSLVLIPLVVDVAYQSWKWPYEVHKDLDIRLSDYSFKNLLMKSTK